MKINPLFILILILIFISACSEQVPLIDYEEADNLRLKNLNNNDCIDLINNSIVLNGIVMYEECGKNCLGGCPSTGPGYCYYGVQGENGCLLFVRSQITPMYGPYISTGKVFNKFEFGEEVKIEGTVELYQNPYSQGEQYGQYIILEDGSEGYTNPFFKAWVFYKKLCYAFLWSIELW